jgi:hypothetical protein
MLTREETAGTTIEILAPYLPYGVEVELTHEVRKSAILFERKQSRGVLIGMTRDEMDEDACLKDMVQLSLFSDRKKWVHSLPAFVRPVLRPFSQLCTPLEDGTVPAVEVARLTLDEHGRKMVDWPAVVATLGDNGIVRVRLDEFGSLYLWPDLRGCNLAAIDYLRQQHFAIGLAPSQFIEKN